MKSIISFLTIVVFFYCWNIVVVKGSENQGSVGLRPELPETRGLITSPLLDSSANMTSAADLANLVRKFLRQYLTGEGTPQLLLFFKII
jgi:hypothetical protein